MAHPADLVLDANYAGPFAADGEYFAPGIPLIAGQGLACRVMRGGRQAGLDIGGVNVRPVMDQETLKVRRSQLPAPAEAGHFLLYPMGRDVPGTTETYRLAGAPECFDRLRREWTCEVAHIRDV